MNYSVYSEHEWLYPDTEITSPVHSVRLDSARGADVCFQVLTDIQLAEPTMISITTELKDSLLPPPVVYQLKDVNVTENTDSVLFTTMDYDSVKDFVTRKAPFRVYDVTAEIDDNTLFPGRVAFFIRCDVPADVRAGLHEINLTLKVGTDVMPLHIDLNVHKAVVPPAGDGYLSMINWLSYGSNVATNFTKVGTPEYYEVQRQYMRNLLDMRNTHLMLPSGAPVRNKDGVVIDFDFSAAETIGNMALEEGFDIIKGGFVARFEEASAEEVYLNWDRKVEVTSYEGYRQLKIYFTRAWECVVRNNWEEYYWQALEDEPQVNNSEHYRILTGICRKFMPGITLCDPIETPYLGGAVEIGSVKQAIYEKYKEEFQKYQALGDELWVYTCGFPSGKIMNRLLDLPILASRELLWMTFGYDMTGFLHYGYAGHAGDPFEKTCCGADNEGHMLPPGDSHISYPDGKGSVWYSIRGHMQREGAEDYELLSLLAEYDLEQAYALQRRVCRTFYDYDTDPVNFAQVRLELLEALDAIL